MNESGAVRGVVISVHELGATVRLDDGTLASVSATEVAANRPRYLASRDERAALAFAVVERRGRRAAVHLQTSATDVESDMPRSDSSQIDFEAQISAYLKSTQTWAPLDRPEPAERHFIRKKRRAAFFEARKAST